MFWGSATSSLSLELGFMATSSLSLEFMGFMATSSLSTSLCVSSLSFHVASFHSTPPRFISCHFVTHMFVSRHVIPLQIASLRFNLLHCVSPRFRFASLRFISLHVASPMPSHPTSFCFDSFHLNRPHFISCRFVSFHLVSAHFASLPSISFHLTSLHAAALHITSFHRVVLFHSCFTSRRFASFQFSSFHFALLRFTSHPASCHSVSFHLNSLHFVSPHSKSSHVVSFLFHSKSSSLCLASLLVASPHSCFTLSRLHFTLSRLTTIPTM